MSENVVTLPVVRIERLDDKMDEWKPIETAPKDGTAIWVAGVGTMEPVRTQSHWHGEWQNIYNGNSIGWKPTHWQPLPVPPPA